MTESKKAILGLIIIFGLLASLFLASPLTRQSIGWGFLPSIATLLLVAACFFGIWKLNTQKDLAPDFLAQEMRSYFDGGGFCFQLKPIIDGTAIVARVYFQNRYDRPCRASIAFRPMGMLTRGVPELSAKVDCEGGAFGYFDLAWPIPSKAAGKVIQLRAFAETRYPQGRGKELRHRSGTFVGEAPTLLGQLRHFGVGGTYAFYKFRLPPQIPPATAVIPCDPAIHILWTPNTPANPGDGASSECNFLAETT